MRNIESQFFWSTLGLHWGQGGEKHLWLLQDGSAIDRASYIHGSLGQTFSVQDTSSQDTSSQGNEATAQDPVKAVIPPTSQHCSRHEETMSQKRPRIRAGLVILNALGGRPGKKLELGRMGVTTVPHVVAWKMATA